MNTSGKIPVNAAACTASSFFTDSAIAAITQENVKLTAITSTIIATALTNPFSNEKPTRYPIPITTRRRMKFLTRSEVARPASIADRAIGSERNRSTSPDFRSSAIPIAVVVAPKIAFWMMIPGIRNMT